MSLLAWVILGLLSGALARWLMGSRSAMGLIETGVLGVVGSFAGGFIFNAIGGTGITGFNLWSMVVATVGAFVVLYLYNRFIR
ncbi:GlsB/YeaQ/YmgE family stress response membrane protein [Vibrio sp. SS-MA-C1-2]|uniref:GlsB/YeaQ/YmgE family stress response membrane protein n=1 Tax=Vibrio sp. SS-MA-C1-2 TaxID=2908646 RepID=UPI001F23EAC8|nr:GlsB/YeaQ/YmgE family stress response membrane protein [Vibrio sp. SS-MA-C1-2]UJF17540.1 GlsB/YeaQ/YmgE family stress response membrane protein [Vibrio sp. SS-MA-C1-2]